MNVYVGELYKEVEYIQSSGTQYIDTGLLVKPDTEVQIDMQLTSAAANVRYFAVETGNNNDGWVAFVVYLDSNKQIAFANGNWSVLRTGRNGDTSRYTFVANNSSLKIYSNGTNVYTGNAAGTRTTNSANNLYLLANDSNGTANLFSSAKLYSCKMYEASTLVRDFIPCYRVSDNVIGLFDKVENKFYANAGTGTFTKGNDVKIFQAELKNAYIGEVYEYSYDFRNKSLSQIQNEGFISVGSSPSFDANGMYGNSIRILKPIDFSKAKKITHRIVGKIGSSGTNDFYYRAIQWSSGSTAYSTNLHGVNLSNGNYNEWFFGGTGNKENFNQTITTGDVAYTFTLDLVNKTASLVFTVGSSNSYTHTITDANITAIKTNNYIYMYTNGSSPKFTSMYVLVEY